ncbi:hypothetical protein ACWC9U_39735, partial [Streptomyces sp. 900116325]
MASVHDETRYETPESDRWRQAGDRIEALLDATSAGGPVARERAEQLVREVVDLYGEALGRVLTIAARAPGLVDELARVREGLAGYGRLAHQASLPSVSSALGPD